MGFARWTKRTIAIVIIIVGAASSASLALPACRTHVGARTVLDSAGPTDFDPSLPRIALPSLAAAEGASRSKTSAPLLMTALDGQRARFEALTIRSVVDGPVVLTEIHVGVRNTDSTRAVEATFAVNLPPGGAITRFAMKAEKGDWQEGRIAEATSARRAYERLVQRGIDPGLVEIDGIDRVRVRLFPMFANEKRDVALTVLHTLPRGDEPFRLPLAGVAVSSIDAQVLVTTTMGKKVATFTTRGPHADDLVLPLRAEFGFGTASAAFNSDGALAARVKMPVTPAAPAEPTAPIQRFVIAFDTSASRFSVLARAIGQLQLLTTEIGNTPIEIACFDQDVEPIYKGSAKGFDAAQVARMAKRGALGSSNLGKALAWIAKGVASEKTPARVLLFTDSAHTFGPRSRADLAPLVHQIRSAGAERIDVISDGARVESGLAALSDLGVVVHASASTSSPSPSSSPKDLLARIQGPAPRALASVKATQSKWHWPRQVDLGFGELEEVVVFADATDPKTVAFSVNDERVAAPVERIGPSPLVTLAIAHAKLRELHARLERATDAPAAYDLRREIMHASLAAGILTSETAFVVLEGEEDYEQARIGGAEGRKVVTVARGGAQAGRTRPAPPSTARGATSGDRDADGIPDQVDRCPEEYEDDDDLSDDDGCPEPEDAVHVVNGRPGLLRQPIRFAGKETEAATSSPATRALLIEIATALRQSPRVGLVEIAGHARALGTPEEALKIADARATSVRALLIKNGVSADRLVARTYGSTKPLKPNDSDKASENDRVEVVVLVVDGKRKEGATPAPTPPPHSGHYGEIAALTADKNEAKAIVRASEWYASSFDPLSFLVLGDALASSGDRTRAARAYGSFADVFPERPTHWRMAAGFLDRLANTEESAASLAIAAYERAAAERPTYFASRRGLAYALSRAGRHEDAFVAALAGLREVTPSREGPLGDERRSDLLALLRSDAALLGASWARVDPSKRDSIEQRLVETGAPIARSPSMHFVLTWENDATNVDLILTDAKGGIATPGTRALRSGGEYRLDVRTGYGPDWFAIDGGRPTGFPYRLSVRYATRGAMGPAIGKVSIVEHDGSGKLAFEDRPFVLMNNMATLDLGVLTSPLATRRDAPPVTKKTK